MFLQKKKEKKGKNTKILKRKCDLYKKCNLLYKNCCRKKYKEKLRPDSFHLVI